MVTEQLNKRQPCILTINAGSSSIKYKVFTHQNNNKNTVLLSGLIEGIAEKTGQWHHHYQQKEQLNCYFSNHQEAFSALEERLKKDLNNKIIVGVGHRVVHGGQHLWQPTIITSAVLTEIKSLAKLAPLHNPINAAGIEYAQSHFKEAIHVAVFDTGFHHTMPNHTHLYAIDTQIAQQFHIQRYGFHGINHDYVSHEAANYLKKSLLTCNFISLHLGNGASACLIKQGKSFDTSMGMTPLAGLIMGTRCGDIDPAIPIFLQEQGLEASQINDLLNKNSGLKGIAHENDMRAIVERFHLGDKEAILALEMYVYAIQKIIGAYLSQTENLDALIFTGGVGENSALIREKIMTPLIHFGFIIDKVLNSAVKKGCCYQLSYQGIPIIIVPGDEESWIAKQVAEKLVNRPQ
ncbi:Acetate kinase (Acetokinase) [Legionella beliardensis]|uniref:Acetate kinase n=1 Tax=Legionella beliardensis TaxID=91822 RepID=A0A378I334_9GAMM|nr:acetate/propionate family kinase [Legionella beliardensis]STX29115.1 Acetate kinase (Acetokinase) [Legionella beliardensis]